MSNFIKNTPEAQSWINKAILHHSQKGAFGKVISGIIWTNSKNDAGEIIVPVDPVELVNQINNDPFILLHSHDPGKPLGQVLESAYFENKFDEKFIVAILAFYAGGEILKFQELGLDTKISVLSPKVLPTLSDDIWIDFGTDPREVDIEWVKQVIEDAPLPINQLDLSHNSAELAQELIRVGVVFLLLVWNPFVTKIATEAGKDTYAALHKWFKKLLKKLADRKNPILDIQTFQDNCQVSFLFRSKDIKISYEGHDKLPDAAAQAAQFIAKLKAREMPVKRLIYEFDQETLKWFPSYAVLYDDRIITDNSMLIALEQIPMGLSLGITTKK
ncbi:hypothetical protein GCM10023211_00350 [Orbus sasakiae]|uniref:Uncharacterized protein n=1 Tax=Orbus sasakiae TaxID=1078475 RepID=A0ABP9N0E3_9GAMM